MRRILHLAAAMSAVLAAGCTDDGPFAVDSDSTASFTQAPSVSTYRGRAYVANVSALGLGVLVSPAGPLPSSGGIRESTLLTVAVDPVLRAGVAGASTVGGGSGVSSHASLAGASVNVGGLRLSAGLLLSRARAVCRTGGADLSGSSLITGLVINGKSIAVTGKPNQVISIGLLIKVTLNEQVTDKDGITVNAVHIRIPFVADVILSSAQAGVSCAPQCPPLTGDFVTGAGTLTIHPSVPEAVFEVAAGELNGEIWGHASYDSRDVIFRSTTVTEYVISGPYERIIRGTGTNDGVETTFEIIVTDGPAGTPDTFEITLSTGYHALRSLKSGDIQIQRETGGCID